MKTMSKLLALILALTMILSMAAVVSADGTGGTIKVTGTNGTTYTVIKMFSAQELEENDYIYTAENDWTAFDGTGYAAGLLTIDDETKNVLLTAEIANSASFAAMAAEYAADKSLTSAITVTATPEGATVDVPTDGYYLLMAAGGGISGVVHVVGGETKVVAEKTAAGTEFPNLIKKVQEDSTGAYGDANSADIGQIINFKVTVHVGAGADSYVIHDVMAPGLSFVEVTSVKLGEDPGRTLDKSAGEYTVTPNTTNPGAPTDGCSFEVAIADSALAGVTAGTALVVNYTARLNDTVAVNTNYANTAWLTHSTGETPKDTTTTVTHAFQINKTRVNTNVGLEGVGFEIYREKDPAKARIQMVDLGGGTFRVCENTACTAHTHVTEAKTNADGLIIINGLDADDYSFHESTVLPGYVAPDKDANATINDGTDVIVPIKLTNALGESLPETGGMGTTLFYVFGGVMVLAAVVLLVTKKRMTTAE